MYKNLEKPEKNICIYGLLDPDTNHLYYIGQTIQGFRRIQEHYSKSNRKSKTTNHLSRSQIWINKLKNENKIFKVIYFEYFDNEYSLDDAEKFWISYFLMLGCNLLNDDFGGHKNRTLYCEQNNRKMISIRTKEAMNNPITKEKCRQNLLKNRHTFNHKKSEETKKKISLAQESKVIYIQDNLGNTYRGLKEAAKELDVTFGTIWKALNGYCKTVKGRTLIKISKGAA